MKLHE